MVRVFEQVTGLLDAAHAQVDRHHRLDAGLAGPRHELVQAERVRLDGLPGEVEPARTVVDRTDAVLPAVAGDEVAARIPDDRDAQLARQLQHVAAKPARVGSGVTRLVHAAVDAPPHVLDERAEQPAVDRPDGEGRIDRHRARGHRPPFGSVVCIVLQRCMQRCKEGMPSGSYVESRRCAVRHRLKDVAERAGVSVKTVSNVVNGYEHVRPDTRARCRGDIAASTTGPTSPPATCARGRTGIIALAVPELDIPYFAELARHVVTAAAGHGWTVLIDQTDGGREQERLVAGGIRDHLIDGLIFSPLALTGADLSGRADGPPMVLLGERVDHGPADHVAIDNVAAARESPPT